LLGSANDVSSLCEAALADPPARKISGTWFNEVRAARAERIKVPLHGRVFEHVRVHRGRHEHRRFGSQIERRQEVVGDPVGELSENVGGRGRDDEEVDARRQRDVLDIRIGSRLELARQHAVARDGLEGELADELARRTGHHGDHVVPLFLEAAHHFNRFVGADSAAYADSNHGHG
jgi:hypothetical protein